MATVKSLDERLDELTVSFESFKAKMDTALALIRWIGVSMAALIVAVVGGVISVAHSAGKFEATVEHQRYTAEEQNKQLRETIKKQETATEEQNKLLFNMNRELAELRSKVRP